MEDDERGAAVSHLLAISIGPVQEFIAAGRRTGDLYAGSALIGEIVQAAARSLAQQPGVELIFPASAGAGAANKILAEVRDGDPHDAAERARAAAIRTLREAWSDALNKLPTEHIDVALAEQQINSFLEFYAAWCPQSGDYPEDRRNVERLLAGRKALRDFKQPQKNVGTFKSPLDPARDTVLRPGENGRTPEACARAPLWLNPSEWLDAVSLLKRVRGQNQRPPSTADLTAATWLEEHSEVREVLGDAPPRAIFRSLHQELMAEGILTDVAASGIDKALGGREPDPYFAILQADGDGIGKKLSGIHSKPEHQEFSRTLGAFAAEARQNIREHGGHLVYSGGDDVLAFLPVHTAIRCAVSLEKAFRATGCTLSVGLAVVHYHEPLYISLDYARAAERKAKDESGSRLALAVHTRGGEGRRRICEWGAGLERWRQWIEAFRPAREVGNTNLGGLSQGFPYEVARLAREVGNTNLPAEALRAEVARIFSRKQGSSQQDVRSLLDDSDLRDPAAIASLAEGLTLWRWLARYPIQWEDAS